ncbi:MAG: DUF4440 domain-containing protein [Verrucomicrobia bacterium]|nr:MAG: DUF4440 domain-containing protein [Verrucomicrobiota bacterium]
MNNDEQAIRELVSNWLDATKRGDVDTVLGLMADDVVFMVPGQEPFGKEAFAAGGESLKGMSIDGTSEIQEIKVLGDWAWIRQRLHVAMTPPGGEQKLLSGYTLSIFRREADGKWRLARDANLVM